MASMSMVQALNSAIDVMLGRDPNVIVFGEDIGFFGGVFRGCDPRDMTVGISAKGFVMKIESEPAQFPKLVGDIFARVGHCAV